MLTWLSSGWGGLTGGGCTRLVMPVSLAVVMFSASRSSSKCAYTQCIIGPPDVQHQTYAYHVQRLCIEAAAL